MPEYSYLYVSATPRLHQRRTGPFLTLKLIRSKKRRPFLVDPFSVYWMLNFRCFELDENWRKHNYNVLTPTTSLLIIDPFRTRHGSDLLNLLIDSGAFSRQWSFYTFYILFCLALGFCISFHSFYDSTDRDRSFIS